MPTEPSPSVPSPERNAALDGIRGIAILMVLLWHLYALVPRPEWTRAIKPLEWFASFGWSGVQLFFVLSGFLIAQNLLRLRGKEHYFRNFYIRRAARILPLYFLCIGLFWVFREGARVLRVDNAALLDQGGIPLWQFIAFVQNYPMAANGGFGGGWLGVTWSLAIEEQFYLLFPALVAACPPKRLGHILIGLMILAPVLNYLVRITSVNGAAWAMLSLPTRIDAFAIGAFVALKLDQGWKPRRMPCLVCGTIAATIFVSTYWTLERVPAGSLTVFRAIYLSAAAFAFAALIAWSATAHEGWIVRLLKLRPLVWFGWTSYALYLFHVPVSYLLHWWIRGSTPSLNSSPSAWASLLALVLLLLLVECLRRYVEQPLIAAARRATAK